MIENIDMKPVDGITGTGGSWFSQIRFGVLPQVLSNFASYTLLRFEVNVRGAAVIGFVGAGGIGQELIVAIRKFYYSDVSAILLMLLVCVMLIDAGSEALRPSAAGRGEPAVTLSVAMAAVVPAEGARNLRDEFAARRPDIEARYGERLSGASHGRVVTVVLVALSIAIYIAAIISFDISPERIWQGFGELADIVALMLPPTPGGHFLLYVDALGQTLSIALLGTLLAAILGAPFGCLAARNVVANKVMHVLARRSLDTLRSIDTLIWALIWIDVVGLGPFAGLLAIASSDFPAIAKLMSEAIETVDKKAVEGVQASGGGKFSTIRFGIVPQVLPVFASQLLYFFESNTRSATIIGIVGAGGIGLHLYEQIRVLEVGQAAFLILMVLVTVAAIDFISQRLRAAIIGTRAG